MAMFPLGSVLFPTMALPLHVFEPRYRQLVKDCLAGEPEFGVVLIERGFEVGGGDARASVGCIARILEIGELEDGRFAMVTAGQERIRVLRWLSDDPYPRAEVEILDDGEAGPDLAQRHQENVVLLRRCLAQLAELGEPVTPATVELSDDPIIGGYQAAALAPLGPADRYDLLAAPDPSTRAALLHEFLVDQRAVLQFRMAELAADSDDTELG